VSFDRSAIMKRAHKDFRYWRRAGEPRSFGACLSNAWAAARLARENGSPKFQASVTTIARTKVARATLRPVARRRTFARRSAW
jgi:hypothetical protein